MRDWMWVGALCLLLMACGPVILGEEDQPELLEPNADADSQSALESTPDAAPPQDIGSSEPSNSQGPVVVVQITPVDCNCVELVAEVLGGQPPYELEWADGARGAQRRVCAGSGDL